MKTLNSDVTEEQMDKWREEFKVDPLTFFVISDNDKEETIFEFIDTQEIDILAMLTYKRSFFESLFNRSFAKELSYHSEIPLLVLHEE